MIQIALYRFQDFLAEYHPLLKDFIQPDAITHEMMLKFAEYLQTRSVGEGAKSILQRFKKVVVLPLTRASWRMIHARELSVSLMTRC